MSYITVEMKDGTQRAFVDRKRPGGNWNTRLETDGPFAVVVDEWGKKTYIPSADIREIVVNGEGEF